jgi:hypothetical protein
MSSIPTSSRPWWMIEIACVSSRIKNLHARPAAPRLMGEVPQWHGVERGAPSGSGLTPSGDFALLQAESPIATLASNARTTTNFM